MSLVWVEKGWDHDGEECPCCSNRNVRKASHGWDGERFTSGWAVRGQGYEAEDLIIAFCPFCGVKLPVPTSSHES